MIWPTITVSDSAAVTLLIPGTQFRAGYIQNNGTHDIRLCLDGYNAPTATSGMLVYAGTQLWLPDYIKNAVKAIAVGGSSSVDVGTDDLTSICPASP